jgi:hypothetical protein
LFKFQPLGLRLAKKSIKLKPYVSFLSFVKWFYYTDINLELFLLSFLFSPFLSTHCRCKGSLMHLITLSNTHTNKHRHTPGSIPLHEGSVRRRDSYLTAYNNHKTAKLLIGFRTRNPSKWAAADPRLRRCGQWDWLKFLHEI